MRPPCEKMARTTSMRERASRICGGEGSLTSGACKLSDERSLPSAGAFRVQHAEPCLDTERRRVYIGVGSTEGKRMNVQRGKLVSGGRLQLPVEVRRELSLSDGDTVLIEVVDGEIHVRPYRDALARVQAKLRKYVEPGRSLSEELIADRRAAANNE